MEAQSCRTHHNNLLMHQLCSYSQKDLHTESSASSYHKIGRRIATHLIQIIQDNYELAHACKNNDRKKDVRPSS